jgi:DNA polymerase (family 10)
VRGSIKAAYMIDGYIHVDFKVVPEESWAFSLCHFTGSKAENIRLRKAALSKGLSLSEYGFKDKDGRIHTYGLKTERDIYEYLGLPYVEPWNR